MFTLGYRFRPWRDDRGAGRRPVDPVLRPRDRPRVRRRPRASVRHTVRSPPTGTPPPPAGRSPRRRRTARRPSRRAFLWSCTGYYDYDQPYRPDFPGIEEYAGDAGPPAALADRPRPTGRSVVVIGSGATAMTLVPALAGRGGGSGDDAAALADLRAGAAGGRPGRPVPAPVAAREGVVRGDPVEERRASRPRATRSVGGGRGFAKRLIRAAATRQLPEGYPVDVHFKPRTTRGTSGCAWCPTATCSAPSGRVGVEVVTDTIDTFTQKGIRLSSGDELVADVVVTATGLNLKLDGRRRVVVDGEPVDLSTAMAYRALMFSGPAQLRVHDRLHQRVVDAEGRPGRRLRVPAARPPRARARDVVVPVPDPGVRRRPSSTSRPATSCARSTCSRSRATAGAVEAAPELLPRPPHHPVRADRRRRARLPLIFT